VFVGRIFFHVELRCGFAHRDKCCVSASLDTFLSFALLIGLLDWFLLRSGILYIFLKRWNLIGSNGY
jgi:hypothetical protein